MGISFSSAENDSIQRAKANIVQQYGGSCDISCNNTISNAKIDIINSDIEGGVRISQTCAVNGQCSIDASQDAVSDIIFRARNSSSAASAIAALGLHFDSSKNYSYQDISQDINQIVNQKCDISSTNDMDNVSIFAENSHIGGGIVIDQSGDARGGCALSSLMSAQAMASASVDNCASAGKKGKKLCKGKSGKGAGYFGGAIGIFLFLFIGIMIISYIAKRKQSS